MEDNNSEGIVPPPPKDLVREKEIERYEKYKEDIINILNKSSENFEKQISYISAGALGLSFIVIEKVVKDIHNSSVKGFLIFGWGCLGLTLLINLISHKFATDCHYKTIRELNNHLKGKKEFDSECVTRRKKQIERFNLTAIVLLFLGIGLVITYTSFNILP